MDEENIELLGKGLIKQPEDTRDLNFAFIAAGAAPIDWTREFRLPEPPNENQGSSDSCVAHATSYYHWQLKGKDYSRRDLFSRIALQYGAYLRDGVKCVVDIGQQTRDECADPAKQTSANMRVKSTLPDSAGSDDKEAKYFINGNALIEMVAQSVRDYKGSVFGVYGDSIGWRDKTNPKPPVAPDWAHALYAMGYHTHNGLKCIIAKSSWCNSTHHEHHIKEDYFNKGFVFDNWVLVPQGASMARRYLVNKGGKIGVLVSEQESFTDVIFWAKSEAHLEQLKKDYEIPADAPTITYPM